jgi:hypothetical protein
MLIFAELTLLDLRCLTTSHISSTFQEGDVIGVLFDATERKVTFYKNGVVAVDQLKQPLSTGVPFRSDGTFEYVPAVLLYRSGEPAPCVTFKFSSRTLTLPLGASAW